MRFSFLCLIRLYNRRPEFIAGLEKIRDQSFKTESKTKTESLKTKTKTKTTKNRSRVLSRSRPRSRELHPCMQLIIGLANGLLLFRLCVLWVTVVQISQLTQNPGHLASREGFRRDAGQPTPNPGRPGNPGRLATLTPYDRRPFGVKLPPVKQGLNKVN